MSEKTESEKTTEREIEKAKAGIARQIIRLMDTPLGADELLTLSEAINKIDGY